MGGGEDNYDDEVRLTAHYLLIYSLNTHQEHFTLNHWKFLKFNDVIHLELDLSSTITQFFLHRIPLKSYFLVYFISLLINWLGKHFTLNLKHDGNKVKLRVEKFISVIWMKNVCFLPSSSARSLFFQYQSAFQKIRWKRSFFIIVW